MTASLQRNSMTRLLAIQLHCHLHVNPNISTDMVIYTASIYNAVDTHLSVDSFQVVVVLLFLAVIYHKCISFPVQLDQLVTSCLQLQISDTHTLADFSFSHLLHPSTCMSQVAQQQSTTGLSSTGSWDVSNLVATTTAACSTYPFQFRTHEQSVSSYCRPAVHSLSSTRANNTSTLGSQKVVTKEEERCKQFLADTCGCKMGVNKNPCSSQFKLEYLLEVRAQAALLNGDQLDMVILGGVMAGMNKGDEIYCGRYKPAKRQRIYTKHIHNGHAVCAVTFRESDRSIG